MKATKKELQKILDKHKLWLESDGKEGERADLRRDAEEMKFKDIQNWFGDRGYKVEENDFKQWIVKGKYLYYTCNDTDHELDEPDKKGNILFCSLNSLYYECEDEIEYDKEIFNVSKK